jgi:O-succinylbenzoic acid--CoA ligase
VGAVLKFEISERGRSGDDTGMVLGADLWREEFPGWERCASFLLLNPRMPEELRARVTGAEFPDLAEHVWLTTSGTGGRLKVVALSRSALEASAVAVNQHLAASASDVWLNPLPTFHVGGLGIEVRSALAGAKSIPFADWHAAEFVRRANEAGATLSSLVPTQVHDLVAADLVAPASLRAVVVGGGVLDAGLQRRATGLGWPLLPSYGLTEAASQVATAELGDASGAWLPLLEHVEARVDEDAVLELRGPSLMTGWIIFDDNGAVQWEDPKQGGWYRTGDRVALRGRGLRVLGRVDDLVKIRGELVDVAALERALQARVSSGDVILRTVADERNGAAIHAVAENDEAAAEARRVEGEVFPPFARPGCIRVGPIPRTALGKPVRL